MTRVPSAAACRTGDRGSWPANEAGSPRGPTCYQAVISQSSGMNAKVVLVLDDSCERHRIMVRRESRGNITTVLAFAPSVTIVPELSKISRRFRGLVGVADSVPN